MSTCSSPPRTARPLCHLVCAPTQKAAGRGPPVCVRGCASRMSYSPARRHSYQKRPPFGQPFSRGGRRENQKIPLSERDQERPSIRISSRQGQGGALGRIRTPRHARSIRSANSATIGKAGSCPSGGLCAPRRSMRASHRNAGRAGATWGGACVRSRDIHDSHNRYYGT